jgi:DNA-directed RNA polymerase subunit RPC12/RpoP
MRKWTQKQKQLLDWASRELVKESPELADPFAAPYVCTHCQCEFTGKVFEQYDTGAAICPDCWRAGRR